MSEQQRASDDDEHWTQPPPSEDGASAWVDLGLNLKRIHSVDTVASTTYAHVSTVLYWNDPATTSRLAGGQASATCTVGTHAKAGQCAR
jgi:hypothetical protein